MNDFFQDPPRLTNTYQSNRWLKSYLRFKFPREAVAEVEKDLQRLGDACAGPYLQLARTAERERPQHIAFDPWGQRSDEIRVSSAWRELQDISAREGMIAIGYKRALGEFSRLHQFFKLYLFHPSSAFFTCPLAMADGAAKVLSLYGKEDEHRAAFRHLTTDQPEEFWTSGQWMTEKAGGSDVGRTGTEARMEGGKMRLYGTKWFSSATTSQMALALARLPDSPDGSKGLTLFLVPMYAAPGRLNHIQVLRLKDKLGTWALPTAELNLNGAYATPVGAKDQGVKTVAAMLNVTRLYNSVCSIGQSTRALEQLRDYSSRRETFGAKLNDHVLHYMTFADEEIKNLAGFLLTFELVHQLGKEEVGTQSAIEREILRLMTPVCKLFTARNAIHIASEVIEGFGGAGYIEDSGIPVHLRDSQVFPIWEGPTNVLSLDLVRVIKSQGLQALREDVMKRLAALKNASAKAHAEELRVKLAEFDKNIAAWMQLPPNSQIGSSKSLAFYLGRLYAFVLLLSWIDSESDGNQKIMAPWLERYRTEYLGEWHPLSEAQCSSAQRVWTHTPGQ